ncbi:DUF6220 domain-containing protein [Paractinoplanes atraurantiacus]|uniref:Uncharacterized protein n=1 Tax=Paractinoplanes atraurantiacus TaxID=1036182 RepID=A0A285K0F1_9ACTN|nr:DUF6220 domain-containing protein [Actinoplanes atraurantiacus]SNY65773.1 hypothetical protein SAMN05421748_128127 [Actinoplanes atraurantiacus]
MRATYRALALLIALSVVVQAAVIAAAWFTVLNDAEAGGVFDENSEYNWGHWVHSVVGMMVVPLLALVLLVVAFFAKVPGGVKWAAIVLGVVVLQIVLAFAGFIAPVLGVLHGLNAFALAGVASIAARKASAPAGARPAVPV